MCLFFNPRIHSAYYSLELIFLKVFVTYFFGVKTVSALIYLWIISYQNIELEADPIILPTVVNIKIWMNFTHPTKSGKNDFFHELHFFKMSCGRQFFIFYKIYFLIVPMHYCDFIEGDDKFCGRSAQVLVKFIYEKTSRAVHTCHFLHFLGKSSFYLLLFGSFFQENKYLKLLFLEKLKRKTG